ncbi:MULTISPECIES: GTP 3',8-cyclase MoaA [unclassified Oceanobacter]|uniref:GTP 3',8-cyclase MoaA n=1 Tax=unclassified Oceanobacter TaxID=2620260 RepID=UPI0026E425D3|nr:MULTISPECIES: GTP 3',8-cyclase MoaA [unclassified Oceanobacter]MDO6683580.1 GTP 3',8-cyclase MoaA [Oceanobacter sp. 5_MG-2023]MDP2608460.1 GTP 3',8-cyclase MoaA [Oceanobacter sp. 1_MG-2023]MDP2611555.1 GTP 3',8-cyclase MoaA [Oceanobacter sp. 2_MG-2023]
MTRFKPELSDRYGRRFSYLRLSITDVCNFRCHYCLPDGYQKTDQPEPLTLAEMTPLLQTFAHLGTRKIRITGGEPSVRKDLTDIISLAAQTPGIEQVALTTNGYRLADQVDDWQQAGLQRLNLSIDSLDPQQFAAITGYSHLDRIMAGLERALSLGLDVKINAVLLRGFNSERLQQFLDWIKHTPVTLRFIELMETGDHPVFFAEHHVSGESIRQQLRDTGWQVAMRHQHDGPAEEFSHPDYRGKLGLIMPYSKDFCSSCNRLRISSLGKLHLCLFGEQGYDIRSLLQPGVDPELLVAELEQRLGLKDETHYLQSGNTGATRHFAMLGG